mgnify:FL=1
MTDTKFIQDWSKSNPWLFLKAYEGSGFNNTNIEKTTDGRKSQFRGPISKDFTCCALWKDKPPERWTNDHYIYGHNILGREGWLVFSTSNRPMQWIRNAMDKGALLTWTYAAAGNGRYSDQTEGTSYKRGCAFKATTELIAQAQEIINTDFVSWTDTARRLGVSTTLLGNLRNKGILTERVQSTTDVA